MPMENSAVTDQDAVFDAVLARIQSQVDEFSKPNLCFLVADPDQFQPNERQPLCLTVAPHAGDFDQGVFDGAADDGILERSGFTVTVWSTIKLDRPDEQTIAMRDAKRGLFPLKKKLLIALSGYMPENTSGAPLLTDYIAPVSAGFPQVARKGLITMSLSFSLNWAWDLSS